MAQGKGHAKLGNYVFRLDPDQIQYGYTIDYSVINTLGGQVIQVLGTTLGDMTITGSFGQDHGNNRESWQMANSFQAAMKSLIDSQLIKPSLGSPAHKPIRFSYQDGVHDWDFQVLIKGVTDPDSSGQAIEYTNGKINYRWQLTLFIVQDSSRKLRQVTQDKFISRVAVGMGWKSSKYNGSTTLTEALKFMTDNSPDGTLAGYEAKGLRDAVLGGDGDPTAAGGVGGAVAKADEEKDKSKDDD